MTTQQEFGPGSFLYSPPEDSLTLIEEERRKEEEKKKAKALLEMEPSGYKNILGVLTGEESLPGVIINNAAESLHQMYGTSIDFAARAGISTAKKLSATMDTFRLMEMQARNGGQDFSISSEDVNGSPIMQTLRSAVPSVGILPVLDTLGDTLMKSGGEVLAAQPLIGDMDKSVLGYLSQKADEGVNAVKTMFELEYGGMSEGMKQLGEAQDWSQVKEALGSDAGGIVRDMGAEAAGYVAALALTRKMPGGSSQLTSAAASSFALNFGTNVQDSIAKGKKVNEALDDGLFKTYADVLGDTMGIGFAGLKFAKKKIYDRVWQFGADSLGSTLLVQQSRQAVDEDLSFGDLVSTFGSNVLFSSPAEIFASVKEHQYDAAVKKIKDAFEANVYTGRTSKDQAADFSVYFSARGEYNQNQSNLVEGTQEVLNVSGLIPPTEGELIAATTRDRADVPTEKRISIDQGQQYLSNGIGNNWGINELPALYADKGLELTHGPNKGKLSAPRAIEETDYAPGKSILAWASPDTDIMKLKLLPGDTTSPDYQLYKAREKVETQIQKDVTEVVDVFVKTFMPNTSLLVTNKSMSPVKKDKNGKLVNNEQGSMTYLDPTSSGVERGILSLNISKFFRQDDTVRQADGSPSLIYDKSGIITTLVHEVGHKYMMDKIKTFSPEAVKGLRASYDHITNSIGKLPLKDAIQILYPKGIIPQFLSTIESKHLDVPFEKFTLFQDNYVMSFREFLANQFAKAALEDSNISSMIPELQPLAKEIQTMTQGIQESLSKEFPEVRKTMTAAFTDMVLRNRMLSERDRLGAPNRTGDTITLESPLTDNAIWNKLTRSNSIFEIDTSSAIDAANDSKIPEVDRRAMKRSLLALGIENGLTPSVDHVELALTFDKYLQFESAVQKNWDSLGPITRGVKKFLGTAPVSIDLIEKSRGSGRIAAIAGTLFQLSELNPNIKELQVYVREHEKAAASRNEELHEAEGLVTHLQQRPKDQLDNMGRVLVDVTIGKFSEKLKLNQGDMPKTLREYGLPPEAGKDVKRVLDYFSSKLTKLQALEVEQINERVKRKEITQKTADEFLSNLSRRYTLLKKTPYFPLMRFGREAVVVRAVRTFIDADGVAIKEGDTVLREHYESKSEADEALNDLRSSLKSDPNVAVVRDTIDKKKTQTPDLPYGLFEGLQKHLENELDVDESVIKEIQDYVREQARDTSFSKRLMRRKNIAGAQTDLLRVIRRYAESYGAFYSGLAHTSKMKKEITAISLDIAERVRTDNDIDHGNRIDQRAGLKAIRDYMVEHFDYMKNPVDVGEGLKALGFFWHLGWDATSAVINTTSIPMFVYPHLSRYVPDSKATSILAGAMSDISRGVKTGKSNISQMERIVLQALEKDGTLTQGLPLEFAALALDKSSSHRFVNKGKEIANTALHQSARMFQATEHFSRQVAALASIRTASERGINDEKGLQEFAKHAVKTTMFEYSRGNRAWLTRNWRSVIFLFNQFTHNSLYFMGRKNSASAKYVALMFGLAGAQGVPGMEDIMDMVNVLGNTLTDGKTDSRKSMREMADGFGIDSDGFMHGASRYGFGIPAAMNSLFGLDVPDVDLSSRMTAGRVVPFGLMDVAGKISAGTPLDDGAGEAMQNTTGAVGSIAWNGLSAISKISKNPTEWKSYEGLMPRFVKQISTGVRWLAEGGEKDSSGSQILDIDYREPSDVMQAVAKMLGTNPTELTKRQELSWMQYQHYQYWTLQRGTLLEQYRHFKIQDMQTKGAISHESRSLMSEIREFNSDAPQGFQIGIDTLESSLRNGLKRDALKQNGFISGTAQSSSFREYEDLFFNRKPTEPQIQVYDVK